MSLFTMHSSVTIPLILHTFKKIWVWSWCLVITEEKRANFPFQKVLTPLATVLWCPPTMVSFCVCVWLWYYFIHSLFSENSVHINRDMYNVLVKMITFSWAVAFLPFKNFSVSIIKTNDKIWTSRQVDSNHQRGKAWISVVFACWIQYCCIFFTKFCEPSWVQLSLCMPLTEAYLPFGIC